MAIANAKEQGFSCAENDKTGRKENVYAVGHSNGGIMMQTDTIEREAGGFIFLASRKLYFGGLYTDLAQVWRNGVCGAIWQPIYIISLLFIASY